MYTKRLFVAAWISVLLLSAAGIAHADSPTQTCRGQFQAAVTQGPDAGLSLAGTLTLKIESSGELEGALVQQDGSQVGVEGRLGHGNIRLRFDVGDDAVIRGVGDVNNPFTCTGSGGGTLVGPRKDDSGNWGIIYGS